MPIADCSGPAEHRLNRLSCSCFEEPMLARLVKCIWLALKIWKNRPMPIIFITQIYKRRDDNCDLHDLAVLVSKFLVGGCSSDN